MFLSVKIHSTSTAPPCHRRLCSVCCVCGPYCQNTQYFYCSTLSQKTVCSVPLCLWPVLSKYTVLLLLHPVTDGCVVSRCVCGPYCQNTQYFYCSTLSQKAVRSVPLCLWSFLSKYTVLLLLHPVTEGCVVSAVSVFRTVKIHSTSTAPPCHRRLCVVSCCVYVPYCQNTQYFCCSTLSQKAVCSVPLCLCSVLSKYTVLLLHHPVREGCVVSRWVCVPYCQNIQYFCCCNLLEKAVCSVPLCLCSVLSKHTVLLLLHPVTEGCVSMPLYTVLSKYDVYILSKKRGHSFPLCLCFNLSKYIVCVLSHPVTEVCVQKAVWCPAVSMFRTVKIHSTCTASPCLRRLCGVLLCLCSVLSKYTVLLLLHPVSEGCVVSCCVYVPYCQNTQYVYCSTLSQKAVWCPAVSMFLTVKLHSTSTAPTC